MMNLSEGPYKEEGGEEEQGVVAHTYNPVIPAFQRLRKEDQEFKARKGEDVGRRFRKVNTVQILCTHVCKWKNETCSN
jgi:hypothetical protein